MTKVIQVVLLTGLPVVPSCKLYNTVESYPSIEMRVSVYYINIIFLRGDIVDCHPEETLSTEAEVDNAFRGVTIYYVTP